MCVEIRIIGREVRELDKIEIKQDKIEIKQYKNKRRTSYRAPITAEKIFERNMKLL